MTILKSQKKSSTHRMPFSSVLTRGAHDPRVTLATRANDDNVSLSFSGNIVIMLNILTFLICRIVGKISY